MGKLTQLLIDRAKAARANLTATTPGAGGNRLRIPAARVRATDESRTADVHDAQMGRRGQYDIAFRRTDRDARPARSVVTAALLGDPWPERPQPGDDPTSYNEAVVSGAFEPPIVGIRLFIKREDLLLSKVE